MTDATPASLFATGKDIGIGIAQYRYGNTTDAIAPNIQQTIVLFSFTGQSFLRNNR